MGKNSLSGHLDTSEPRGMETVRVVWASYIALLSPSAENCGNEDFESARGISFYKLDNMQSHLEGLVFLVKQRCISDSYV